MEQAHGVITTCKREEQKKYVHCRFNGANPVNQNLMKEQLEFLKNYTQHQLYLTDMTHTLLQNNLV